ncbi:hypothetical protein [Yinghuangia sp. YIM S10712]|uniref:hypothetical protein n=1 Tax=Yinghuangia sp. YIM S10712 TaxID=3436930 RepID=UPI003F52ABF2
MTPSVPAPDPDPAIPPNPAARNASDITPPGERQVTVIPPDQPPVITPPVAAALLRLLLDAQQRADDEDAPDSTERNAA